MTHSSSTLRRRRLAAAVLAIPLMLGMTGTALATGDSTSPGKRAGGPHERASSSSPDKHGTSTTPPLTSPQPLSNADQNGTGANPGPTCSHSYCSTRDGSASENGRGDGGAEGKPCAGCVGQADNKNPPGQAPDGSDHNAGYECDRNQGIGKTNPAHTGCRTTTAGSPSSPPASPTTQPSPTASASPKVSASPTTPVIPVTPTSPAASPSAPVSPAASPSSTVLPPSTPITGNPPNQGAGGPVTGPPANLPPANLPPTDVPPVTVPPTDVPPVGNSPITGTPPDLPVANPVPVVGPPVDVAPDLIGGTPTLPADRPTAAGRPSTLPFTGTDTLLLLGLGGSLLVAGGSILLAVRREEARLA